MNGSTYVYPMLPPQIISYTSGSSAEICVRCLGHGVIPAEIEHFAYLCDHCDGTGRPRKRWWGPT